MIQMPYFFKNRGTGRLIADEFLHQVIHRRKRANGAPEASEEQENHRDDRPPQHPGQGGTHVVMR